MNPHFFYILCLFLLPLSFGCRPGRTEMRGNAAECGAAEQTPSPEKTVFIRNISPVPVNYLEFNPTPDTPPKNMPKKLSKQVSIEDWIKKY
jgi:hypothetical protein